jgi:hypothetical protein
VNGSLNPDYGLKGQEICWSGFSRDPGQELLCDVALKGTPAEKRLSFDFYSFGLIRTII